MRYVLIGAGGQALEARFIPVLDPLVSCDRMEISGHVVDRGYGRAGDMIGVFPILGDLEWLREQVDIKALCAIGYPRVRKRLVNRVPGVEFFSLCHSWACTDSATYGVGTIIAANAIAMNDVKIGNHALLNIASSVSHGSKLGDFCTLSPGARVAGNCTLGEGVFLGMNAVVIENVTIGDWAKIGAGAVVLEDVPAGATVVGVPGRVVKRD